MGPLRVYYLLMGWQWCRLIRPFRMARWGILDKRI